MFPSGVWSCIIQSLQPRAAPLPAWQLRFEAKTEEIDCNFFVISTVRPADDHFLLTRNDALDTVEEIIDYIDEKIPCPNILNDNNFAETVARDFFSKFCFFIKVRLDLKRAEFQSNKSQQ